MKKSVLTLILFLNLFTLFSQETDSLGIDFNPKLSHIESEFINKEFIRDSNDFDFKNKKVGFAFTDGDFLTNKNNYFRLKRESINKRLYKLVILNSIEKNKTADYDAIILIQDKPSLLTERKREEIIEKIALSEKSIPTNLFKLGLDDNAVLTDYESEYFNNKYKDRKNKIDFTEKKIAFFIGNNGSRIQTKKDYFNSIKDRLTCGYDDSFDEIITLTNSEKKESGGYDAIILSWSKIKPTAKFENRMKNKLKK